MRRVRLVGILIAVAGCSGWAMHESDAHAAGKVAASGPAAPPLVRDPIRLLPEGLHFGMTPDEVADFYDKVLDQDYVPLYKRTQPGPQLKALDAALADQKAALRRSRIDFGTLPTGIDQTPLKGEYGYKNNETLLSINRGGQTRYFFFVSNRMWKVYDEIQLKAGGDMGATFVDATGALQRRYAVSGRVNAANFAQGWRFTEVDWADNVSHVRAVDRSDENLVGVVYEERTTADRLAAFRKNQKVDEGGVDPSILAVTRGGPSDDTNAHAADALTGKSHASPGAAAAPPAAKKKK